MIFPSSESLHHQQENPRPDERDKKIILPMDLNYYTAFIKNLYIPMFSSKD